MDGSVMTDDAPKTYKLPEGFADEDEFLKDAREKFQNAVDFDRLNREEGLEDLRFLAGEQWDLDAKAARKGRPMLTINRLPQFVAQVVGDIRINKPAIKVRPAEDADKDLAEVREGLIRAIERESDAQGVYSNAGQNQVGCGIGNFRISLKYATDDGFDRDISVDAIPNAFAVSWDPLSTERTGKDAGHCFVSDQMPRKLYEKLHGTVLSSGLEVPQHDTEGWYAKDVVRVTEYHLIKETPVELALLASGAVVPADKVPKGEKPVKTRKSIKRSACMYLITGQKILSGPHELPIDRVPIIRVQGWEISIGDKRVRFGLVRFARDPQRLQNYWRSISAEMLALAPKGKWVLNESQEGDADEFRDALKSDDPVLTYTGAQEPTYVPPPTLNSAVLQESTLNAQDMKDVTGLHDASLGAQSNETSGKAIMARERQGDTATYIYHDNLHAAIQEGGRVINQLIPTVFDTARTIRILGADEATKIQRINDGPDSIDINQGKFDIVVETGPSYSTKRVEAAESMMQFVQAVPTAGQVAGDLIAQAQDWPLADKIAERLKATLPPQVLAADGQDDQTPEQQQMRAQQAQQAQQQAETQNMAQRLELSEKAAKVDDIKAAAKLKNAQADKVSSEASGQGGDQQHDFLTRAAQLRIANANAAEAEANAGIAYFNLSRMGDPRLLEAQALAEEGKALSAHAGGKAAVADLHMKPLDAAHSVADLNTKLNPPEPAEAEPAQAAA